MTPDQVTQMLTLLQNVPAQALLGIGLYILWRSFSQIVERTFSLLEQWSALAMKIVENASAIRPVALLPARSTELNREQPPAPG